MIKSLSLYFSNQKIIRWTIVNLMMAIAYIIAIHLSHEFTSLSGDVASVWFPCSILLPMVWMYGEKIIPGIVIGSILGLIPSVNALEPSLSFVNQIIFIGICSFTDLIQPFIIIFLLKRLSDYRYIFTNLYSVCIFIIASILVPLIPGWIGATTLLTMGIVKYSEYGLSIISWWWSCAFAYLLFSPPPIIAQEIDIMPKKAKLGELIILFSLLSLICFMVFRLSDHLEYLLLLILLWSSFRLPRFYTSLLVSFVALIAIVSTAKGYGVFASDSVNQSLLYLQSFLATFSLTALILSAVLNERTITRLTLHKTLDSLETKVLERTEKLRKTQSRLEEANKVLRKMVNIDFYLFLWLNIVLDPLDLLKFLMAD